MYLLDISSLFKNGEAKRRNIFGTWKNNHISKLSHVPKYDKFLYN